MFEFTMGCPSSLVQKIKVRNGENEGISKADQQYLDFGRGYDESSDPEKGALRCIPEDRASLSSDKSISESKRECLKTKTARLRTSIYDFFGGDLYRGIPNSDEQRASCTYSDDRNGDKYYGSKDDVPHSLIRSFIQTRGILFLIAFIITLEIGFGVYAATPTGKESSDSSKTGPRQVFSTSTEHQVGYSEGHDENGYPWINKAMIDKTCSEEMTAKPQAFVKCQKMCAPMMGCLEEAGTKGTHNVKECDKYSACKILIDDSGNGGGSLEEVCGTKNISSNKGYGECQRLCSKRACCFLPIGSNSCDIPGLQWCDEFRVCENLLNIQPSDI